MVDRYLRAQVLRDLDRKMVFVAGPRQVGKTYLALSIDGAEAGYLNWDVPAHRERILRQELPPGPLWVFDEIHRFRGWRGYLKGLWDEAPGRRRILVTGSARLELLRYGGDSLQGRYHLLRLHPLSAAELGLETAEDLDDLLRLGGFPEPFLGGGEVEARRWLREYRTRLLEEEITSLSGVRDLGRLELLMLRLPDLVGSPLSINALREDLQVSHKTVSAWVDTLERLYGLFRVLPFGGPRLRAIKKMTKHYHFSWNAVPTAPERFEDLVACHLLKWVHHCQDVEGRDLELRFYRDGEGREVDFVITEGGKPIRLVECKLSDAPVDRGVRYLKRRFPAAEAWQISAAGRKDFQSREGIRVAPALKLLGGLV